ncbi:MAG: KH domain-containing protein [Clostridia bacterium]|nr:KH domain-containing protein [Clostridia bacterium]
MKSIESQGKTVDQAIEIGLYKLGATRNDVKIEILEQAGLFNKAKVRLSLSTTSPEEAIVKELVEKIIKLMGLDLEVYVEERENDFFVNVTGADAAIFIGKHGDSIEEFQTVVNAIYNKDKPREESKRVTVDSNNYVVRRQDTLTNLAKRTAGKVIRDHKEFKFEPMNSYERRIIHSALSDHDKVITESYGNEPNRYVVVKLKSNITKSKNYDETKDYFEDDSVSEVPDTRAKTEHRTDAD